MLVDHVTFSKTGGAGEVASLLAKAQKDLGADVQLLSLIDKDLRSQPFAAPAITAAAFADEFLVSNHSSPTIISLARSKLNKISMNDLRQESVIHLHWVSGLIDHRRVKSLLDAGRKVVWTLHDMAPFTGACHHSHGCDQFESACENCPQVRPAFRKAVSLNLEPKVFAGREKNLVLVAPTNWMANQAKNSTAFRNQRIEVIENPIREEFFVDASGQDGKQQSLPSGGNSPLILAVVASDLSNPAKGIQWLVEQFAKLRELDPEIRLNLIGRRGEKFHQPQLGIDWRGSLAATELISVARESNLLVSASSAESAGLTVREFGALGIPTIALRAGGIENLIRDGVSGMLVSNKTELLEKLTAIIRNELEINQLGKKARELAVQNNPSITAQSYLSLYSSIS